MTSSVKTTIVFNFWFILLITLSSGTYLAVWKTGLIDAIEYGATPEWFAFRNLEQRLHATENDPTVLNELNQIFKRRSAKEDYRHIMGWEYFAAYSSDPGLLYITHLDSDTFIRFDLIQVECIEYGRMGLR